MLLKNICKPNEIGKYGIPASAEDYDESKVRYLRISDIDDFGKLLDKDKKSVSATDINKYILEENDIVVARTGNSTGRTYFHEKKNGILAFAGFLIKYGLDNNKVNPKYLKYYTISSEYKQWVKNLSVGSTRGNINAQTFANCPILLPERKQQNFLVSILSLLDDKIELNNRINDNLEQMAKTLYDYWFVQFDFPNENGKPYKSSGGKMVFNEVVKREIPEGWEVKSLYDIAEFINGLACQKYRPLNENEDYLAVIKIKEMNDGLSQNTEKVTVDIPEKHKIYDGDVLFSWSATLDVKIWSLGKGALNQHIFKVTSSKYPKYFYFFEISNYLQHFKMMAELRKTTMGHITKDHLIESRISVPPLKIITELEKIIDPYLENILTNRKQNQQLSDLRDWLLPMLMNGQVTVE